MIFDRFWCLIKFFIIFLASNICLFNASFSFSSIAFCPRTLIAFWSSRRYNCGTIRSTSMSYNTLKGCLSGFLSITFNRDNFWYALLACLSSSPEACICLTKTREMRSISCSGLSGLRTPLSCMYPMSCSHCYSPNTSRWSSSESSPLTDTAKGLTSMRPLTPFRWKRPRKLLPFILRNRWRRKSVTDL